jgi:hypothetical protein
MPAKREPGCRVLTPVLSEVRYGLEAESQRAGLKACVGNTSASLWVCPRGCSPDDHVDDGSVQWFDKIEPDRIAVAPGDASIPALQRRQDDPRVRAGDKVSRIGYAASVSRQVLDMHAEAAAPAWPEVGVKRNGRTCGPAPITCGPHLKPIRSDPVTRLG